MVGKKNKIGGSPFFDSKTLAIYLIILLIGGWFRFHELALRPMHHDEAVRGFSLTLPLLKGKVWNYDPAFHGPFLQFTTAGLFWAFGDSDFTLRILEAVFGFLLILLLYPLKDYLGKRGLLYSSALLAVSPAFVHYSKMAIQTVYLHFFEMASLVTIFLYSKTHKARYAHLAAVSLAFGFTVKESMYVFVGLFGPYLVIRFVLSLFKRTGRVKKKTRLLRLNIIGWYQRVRNNLMVIAVSMLIFSAIHVSMFSHFGQNWENVENAIITPFTFWQDRVTYRHTKPWSYYLKVIKDAELLLVAVGILGILNSLIQKRELGVLFSYWAVVGYLVYSFAIDFKEPWLITHAFLPLIPLSGMLVEDLWNKYAKKRSKIGMMILCLLIFGSVGSYAQLSYDKNFVSYWKESNKLTYVQAYHDVNELVDTVDNLSFRHTGGRDLDVVYAFDENYPIAWYFRNYSKIRYFKGPVSGINGWNGTIWGGEGVAEWANDEVVSGKRSVKISSSNGADGSWQQIIPAQGGRSYTLTGYIKTSDIRNVNASKVAQVFVRGNNSNQVLVESPRLEGNNDWTPFKLPFTLPADEQYIRINLAIAGWGTAKGTIWFDDLKLDGGNLINADFEEGRSEGSYPSVYIISSKSEYSVSPEFAGRYVKKKYEIRPRVHVLAYYRKDLL